MVPIFLSKANVVATSIFYAKTYNPFSLYFPLRQERELRWHGTEKKKEETRF